MRIKARYSTALWPLASSLLRGVSLLVILLMSFSGSAFAKDGLDIRILNPPAAPITVDDCNVQVYNVVLTISGTRVPGINSNVFVSFKNTSSSVAIATKMKFVFKDYFGATEFTGYGESAGAFAPSVEIKPAFNPISGTLKSNSPNEYTFNFPASLVGEVDCSVEAVRFEDGTIWSAEDPTAAPASAIPATASPIATSRPSQAKI